MYPKLLSSSSILKVFVSCGTKVNHPPQPMLVSKASRIYNAVLEANVGVDAGSISNIRPMFSGSKTLRSCGIFAYFDFF